MTFSLESVRPTFLQGDVRAMLKTLPDESVHCVVTSPPYWNLRNYKMEGQIGLEETPEEYVKTMVEVFREVWRVLRNDGVLWLNLGDCYASQPGWGRGESPETRGDWDGRPRAAVNGPPRQLKGLKPKDLCGIPFRVALALQADGWWLRNDIIWSKPNPMPESTRDRCTRAHEYLFHLTKSARYFYDADAIREPWSPETWGLRLDGSYGGKSTKLYAEAGVQEPKGIKERLAARLKTVQNQHVGGRRQAPEPGEPNAFHPNGRNKRTVWQISTQPYPMAHFATFPEALVEPCLLAGTSAEGCCAECGAPWERITEQSDSEHEIQPNTKFSEGRSNAKRVQMLRDSARAKGSEYISKAKELGWQPTCECKAEVVPCTVLDPFGGSGTVSVVAMRLRRRSIWIDLNPEYQQLAMKRCGIAPKDPKVRPLSLSPTPSSD